MLAELRGKLSAESGPDLERLEDLLTDYVFGTIKYLDRQVLAAVLGMAFPSLTFPSSDLERAEFLFWPMFGGTEPDVVILVGRQPIVVEAKLASGFGLGDAPGESQLVREYRRASEWAGPRKLAPPLVLAVTAGFGEPEEIATANALLGPSVDGSAVVRWCNWQRIAAAVESVRDQIGPRGRDSAADLLRVLERRGVRYMFEGFAIEDYWLMAAAQRRATAVVFPTIATFCKDLIERLAEHSIWGDPYIHSHQSWTLNSPGRWGGNYLYLQAWPYDWPKRKQWMDAILFVQFSLREPVVWVGCRHRVKTAQKPLWNAAADQIAAGIAATAGGRVATAARYPDFDVLINSREATHVDAAWLQGLPGSTEFFFTLHWALPLELLSQTAAVVDMLQEDKAYIESIPFLLGDGLPKP